MDQTHDNLRISAALVETWVRLQEERPPSVSFPLGSNPSSSEGITIYLSFENQYKSDFDQPFCIRRWEAHIVRAPRASTSTCGSTSRVRFECSKEGKDRNESIRCLFRELSSVNPTGLLIETRVFLERLANSSRILIFECVSTLFLQRDEVLRSDPFQPLQTLISWHGSRVDR